MTFTYVYGIVSLALPVHSDERSTVIALELIVRRKRLRRLPAKESPLRALCAVALRHTTIVAMLQECGAHPLSEAWRKRNLSSRLSQSTARMAVVPGGAATNWN